jgi:hypothetical protein
MVANTLRDCKLRFLDVDISGASSSELEELENTLMKHNSNLVSLKSSRIDWKNVQGPLYGIYKALLANEWLSGSQSGPADPKIQDAVNLKMSYKKQHKPKLDSFGGFGDDPSLDSEAVKVDTPHFPQEEDEFIKEAYGNIEKELDKSI